MSNKLTRLEVYALIDGERAHQDAKWPQTPVHLPPSDEARLIRVLLNEADAKWYVTPDDKSNGVKVNPADLIAMRKIAAVCVRCMEVFGAPPR